MDPISVIILAAIYAALRGPREARRAVGRDYRGRRDRWTSRAEPWMSPRGRGYGRGRGGRRVAGYDRNGRAFTRDQATGRRTGDPGWRSDSRAWRGPEGRARVARGIRPSAIRAGIITGALAYTALFGAGVAARGFARGTAGGYRMGKAHYRAKRANANPDPTITVTPGKPGDAPGPADEIIDAVIVDDGSTPETEAGETAGAAHKPPPDEGRDAWIPAGWEITEADTREHVGEDDYVLIDQVTETARPAGDMKTGPWLLVVHGPGINRFNGDDSEGIAVYDAADLDRRLALIAAMPGLSAEVRPLPDPLKDSRPQSAAGSATTPGGANVTETDNYEWQCPECGEPVEENSPTSWTPAWGQAPSYSHLDGEPLCPVVGAHGYEPAQPEPRDPRPSTAGPSNDTPGDDSLSEITTTRPNTPAPAGITGQYVPVGATSINAPVLMEGANYDAHLHNLEVIAKEARAEYSSAELTLASAGAARQRAEHAMAAVEQMAVGLAAQDFGETHVGNMSSLHELLAAHVAHARAAERAAQESLATSEQLIEMCVSAANVFRRDHGQLAEAHANAPHAARTREAYQPM